MSSTAIPEQRAPTEKIPDVIDLTYATTEDEDDDDVRLEGFVVSDSEIEYLSDTDDDDAVIVKQAAAVEDLGTTFAAGRRVSTRARKPTERYVHPDAAEVNAAFDAEASTDAETDSDMSVGNDSDVYEPDAESDSEDDT